jgi:hypothetical protein
VDGGSGGWGRDVAAKQLGRAVTDRRSGHEGSYHGKDPQDTAIRQAAAMLVFKDVIEAFTDKDVMELGQMPPGAELRYREYDRVSHSIYRGALAPVWKLQGIQAFAEPASDKHRPTLLTPISLDELSRITGVKFLMLLFDQDGVLQRAAPKIALQLRDVWRS